MGHVLSTAGGLALNRQWATSRSQRLPNTATDMPRTGPPAVYRLTWAHFDSLVAEIAGSIRASTARPNCVVGIARGGCVPAVALSHALSIPDFSVILARVHKTDAVRANKTEVHAESIAGQHEFRDRRVLLVDDVIHTGATARACYDFVLRSRPSMITFAALLRDTVDVTRRILLPCTQVIPKSVHAWVVFPWEYTSRQRPRRLTTQSPRPAR